MALSSSAACRIGKTFLSVVATATTLSVAGTAFAQNPWVIYGKDDRLEVYEESDAAKQILADSVVALLPDASVLKSSTIGMLQLDGPTLGVDYKLCKNEKFFDEITPAFCTGVLVSDNVIATAGHCVEDANFCSTTSFVFGFNQKTSTSDPSQVQEQDVYRCKTVLHSEVDGSGPDFALVQLDRPVIGRKPIAIASKLPAVDDAVFVIGHPVGLPAKIAGGANVRSRQSGYYIANLDTFGGNSGSPVFNDNYEVAGILVRGEQDFEKRGSCNVSFRCKNALCRGEDVTNPDVVKAKLMALLSNPGPGPTPAPATPPRTPVGGPSRAPSSSHTVR